MNRVKYFDIAKGIGIILVVLGHIEYISEPLRYFVVSFHMPMFFVISGMLMLFTGEERKETKTFIKGKLFRIGIPYLFFSVCYLVLKVVFMYLTGAVDVWSFVQDLWLTVCLYGISVLWFLPAMFFGSLMLFGLRKKLSNKLTIIVVVAMTTLAYFLNILLNLHPGIYNCNMLLAEGYFFVCMLLKGVFALFFLSVGYYAYFAKQILNEKTNIVMPNFAKFIMGIALLFLVYLLSQLNGAVDINFLIFGNPGLYLVCSIIGSLAIIMISNSLEELSDTIVCRALAFFGKNSLVIMATHINFYVMYVSLIISMHIIDMLPVYSLLREIIFILMILILVFIIETPLSLFMRKFLPVFTGQAKQKKK